MKRSYILDMEGEDGSGVKLFKHQRATLGAIISSGCDLNLFTIKEADTLDGIQNLLDEIADQMKDNYGLHALNTTVEIYNPETNETENIDEELFDEWCREVGQGDTVLGFIEWHQHQQEIA